MKTKATIAAALCILSFLSCTREVDEMTPGAEGMQFRASTDVSTKTSLSGTMVRWEESDKLSLWYGTLGVQMEQSDYFVGGIEFDARYATLKGFARPSDDYIAVCPRSAALACSKDGTLTLSFAAEQRLRPGSFADDANVAVACSNSDNLAFRNAGGLLALKVTSSGGHTIKKIRLAGTSAMAGTVEMTQASIESGEPVASVSGDCFNYLTLDCGDGLKDMGENMGASEIFFDEPGLWVETKSVEYTGDNMFYLVSLPGTHEGFVLTLVDSEGRTAVARSGYSYSIERNSNTFIATIGLSDSKFKPDPQVYINAVNLTSKIIELYNPNAKDVDLSGWLLSNDGQGWAFPAGSVISAGSCLVVAFNQSDCSAGPCFDISGSEVYELKLSNGSLVDSVGNRKEIY